MQIANQQQRKIFRLIMIIICENICIFIQQSVRNPEIFPTTLIGINDNSNSY
jgi:hypothetical protein